MINFVKTTSTDPVKQFELCLHHISTGIFFPTQELYDFVHADIKHQCSTDLETEAIREIAAQLADLFPPYGVNFGMTRLEISIALGAAKVKVQ